MCSVKIPRFKFLLKVMLTLAIIAGVYVAYRAIRNNHYEKQLAEVIARLDADEPGWQWEDRFDRLPKLSKEENAGEEIKAIMRLLTLDEYRARLGKNQWCNDYVKYESDKATELCAEFLCDHPNAKLTESYRENIRKFLMTSPCPEALDRARRLHSFRGSMFPHRYRPFLAMSGLPDIQSPRELVRLFGWNAALLAEDKPELAANEISVMFSIAKAYQNDPFGVSALTRVALVRSCCLTTHRLLAQSQLSPATLLRLQKEFQQEEASMISLAEIYRWERALHDHDLKLLHSGEYTLNEFLENQSSMYINGPAITQWPWLDSLLKRVYPPIVLKFWGEPRHYARERADLLKFYDRVIQWSASPEHQLLDRFKSMSAEGPGVSPFVYMRNAYSSSEDDYKKNSYMGIGSMARAMLSYRANCRCITAALAAERYRLDHGTWPTTWEQLSPKYLPATLLDPFTGKPLIIKKLPDGIMIYTVYYNGIDDGGKIFPTDKQFQGDIGYRLWNPEQRRVDMSKEFKVIEDEFKGDNE